MCINCYTGLSLQQGSVYSPLCTYRKLQNLHQYNILHTQDDSDALLDDDEAPLDLNVDFATRQSSRDDGMLDVGKP